MELSGKNQIAERLTFYAFLARTDPERVERIRRPSHEHDHTRALPIGTTLTKSALQNPIIAGGLLAPPTQARPRYVARLAADAERAVRGAAEPTHSILF